MQYVFFIKIAQSLFVYAYFIKFIALHVLQHNLSCMYSLDFCALYCIFYFSICVNRDDYYSRTVYIVTTNYPF